MRCLALLMPRTMMASGTRNEFATSVAVGPPTVVSMQLIRFLMELKGPPVCGQCGRAMTATTAHHRP
jgi:hypothetical protein